MTIPGPPKTPTALRILRGNPSRRPLPTNEPEPNSTRPTCPSWLDPEARAEWRRIVGDLHRIGLLRRVDRAALATYCDQWSRLKRAHEHTAKYGDVMSRIRTDQDGSQYVELTANPYVAIAGACAQRIRMLCQEFGLTPSARGRMQLPGEVAAVDDEFAREYGG